MDDIQTLFDSDEAENEYMKEQEARRLKAEEKKQIEEMARHIPARIFAYDVSENSANLDEKHREIVAEHLYGAGYRKQSEGEWKIKSGSYRMIDDFDEELFVECPFCGRTFWVPYEFDDKKTFEYAREHYPYCNCGAKMKGV